MDMVDSQDVPATPSNSVTPRTPLPRWTVPVVALVVLATTAVVLVVLWRWVDGLALVDVDKKATAQLDVVKVAASIAVGGGGLFALYLAARRHPVGLWSATSCPPTKAVSPACATPACWPR